MTNQQHPRTARYSVGDAVKWSLQEDERVTYEIVECRGYNEYLKDYSYRIRLTGGVLYYAIESELRPAPPVDVPTDEKTEQIKESAAGIFKSRMDTIRAEKDVVERELRDAMDGRDIVIKAHPDDVKEQPTATAGWEEELREFVLSNPDEVFIHPQYAFYDDLSDFIRTILAKREAEVRKEERCKHGALCPNCNDYMELTLGSQPGAQNTYYCFGCNAHFVFQLLVTKGQHAK